MRLTELSSGHIIANDTRIGAADDLANAQFTFMLGMTECPATHHLARNVHVSATEAQAQVDLFAAPPAMETVAASALDMRLAVINPDALCPREALYQLEALAANS